ncbi:C-type lectin domain family 10 member A-like [Heptranchias perlo]|uniref:C-type lectin domain family 10 member A-like n=1 Tax=Heptranchias perlo TaxID=212740 RepID=UPI003559887E
MDEPPSTDTVQSLHIFDNENVLLSKEGFNWIRMSRQGGKKRCVQVIVTLCLIFLGVVTAMAIFAHVKLSNDVKELRDSIGNIVGTGKSPENESEIEIPAEKIFDYITAFNSQQKIKSYDLQNSKEIKHLQDSIKNLNTELQSLKALQIPEKITQLQGSITVLDNGLKALNDSQIPADVKQLENSVAILHAEIQRLKARKHCQVEWTLFAGKCYFFSTSEVSFEEARAFCQSSQSNIVVINNMTEQDFLAKRAQSQYYWIGLTDLIKEGVWRWEDGTSYSSTPIRWKPGQPDNFRKNEHCVHLVSEGLWNDDNCLTKYKYICEKIPN